MAVKSQHLKGVFYGNHKLFDDENDPRLVKHFIAEAQARATRDGFSDKLAAFESAAAAFPVAPPMMCATLLERPPIITPNVEQWRRDFVAVQEQMAKASEPALPKELVEIFEEWKATAAEERRAKSVADAAAEGVAGRAGQSGKMLASQRKRLAQAAKSGVDALDKFSMDEYEARRLAAQRGEEAASLAASRTRVAPRLTKNDEIGNTRTLDRAYADRLILCVRDAKTGVWTLPMGAYDVAGKEKLTDCAHRHLAAAVGSDVDPWFIGNAPIGVRLEVFSPEQQSALRCFGRKVFVFRADILDGRVELGAEYNDYQWLTRVEALKQRIFDDERGDQWAEYVHRISGWSENEFWVLANDQAAQVEQGPRA